jgi:hypothetical protein
MAKHIRNIVKSATMMAFVALLLAIAAISGVSGASAASAASPASAATYGKLNLTAYNAMATQAGFAGIGNASVAISANDSANDRFIVKGTTNETGAFSSYVPQGVYTLQVSAQGFQTFTKQIKIAAGQSANVQAPLMPVASDPAVTQGKLSVKVQAIQTSTAGPVLVQAMVYVINSAGVTVAKGTTNSLSVFETKLAAGSYKLLVRADGFKDTSLSVDIYSGKATEATATLTR